MSDIVIKSENLGKMYTIGHHAERGTYMALRDVLMQNARTLWSKTKDLVTGKPVIQGDIMEEVWALKNVNLEIKRGEAIGIIGRNGAGKSTLLKVLSRITEPSTGRVIIKGRVASLLEVGTGFHPELTGRENIYLNGTILGMTRAEIRRKFDEIVAFAEVEKYLDTPVKRYSSGMYVRLAFAVAAHLESEILIVDEVLAVGDAEFQKKCLSKMGEVSKGDGRTVLFVSHNMSAVQKLCNTGILMTKGGIEYVGRTGDVIDHYLQLQAFNKVLNVTDVKGTGNKSVVIEKISMIDSSGKTKVTFSPNEKIFLEFHIKSNVNILQNSSSFLDVGFNNHRDERVAWISSSIYSDLIDIKNGKVTFVIEQFNLVPGEYNLNYMLVVNGSTSEWKQNVCYFEIIDNDFYGTGRSINKEQGYIALIFNLKC
jgi:lipopolysaccharide transport system ATP-binding protein